MHVLALALQQCIKVALHTTTAPASTTVLERTEAGANVPLPTRGGGAPDFEKSYDDVARMMRDRKVRFMATDMGLYLTAFVGAMRQREHGDPRRRIVFLQRRQR